MAVQFEFYKNPVQGEEEGETSYHPRVVNFQHVKTGSRNSLGNYLWQGRSGSNVNGTQSVHGKSLTRRAKSTS